MESKVEFFHCQLLPSGREFFINFRDLPYSTKVNVRVCVCTAARTASMQGEFEFESDAAKGRENSWVGKEKRLMDGWMEETIHEENIFQGLQTLWRIFTWILCGFLLQRKWHFFKTKKILLFEVKNSVSVTKNTKFKRSHRSSGTNSVKLDISSQQVSKKISRKVDLLQDFCLWMQIIYAIIYFRFTIFPPQTAFKKISKLNHPFLVEFFIKTVLLPALFPRK